ncbi:hypothetical protein JCM3775_000316 [Rhodotorula graminis]
MFRLPFSSSSTPSPEHDALTTLPPRRFSRSSSIFTTPTPTSPPSTASSPPAADWTSRHSFAELLSRDPRSSVLVRDASLYGDGAQVGGGEEQDGRDGHGEGMLALPGADFGVVGSDAHLFLQELQRLRTSLALKRRRRTGYVAGVLSLVVLGVTFWFEVEACVALVKSGGSGRGALRWVEMAVWLSVLFLWVAVLLFLRSRRPSILCLVGLSSAALSSFLHLSLVFANFVLSFVWKGELVDRCDWGIDVAWTSGDKGDDCEGEGWKGWSGAAVVRLLVTAAFLTIWLVVLRRYHRTLFTPAVVSPSQLPSAELRALLGRHRADIVPLSSAFHPPTIVDPSAVHPDALPHAPDRATAFYASVSDGAWSYDVEHARWGSSASRASRGAGADVAGGAGGSASASGGGAAQWLGAKLWGGVAWFLGVPSYDAAATLEEEAKALREKDAEPGAGRRSVEGLERSAAHVGGEHVARPQPAHPVSYEAWLDESAAAARDGHDYGSLFSGLRRPGSFASSSSPSLSLSSKRLSTGSAAPLLGSPSSSSPSPDPSPRDDAHQPPRNLPPSPSPPRRSPTDPPTGSSGSIRGAIVYVRMSDGRLVRRLSTIASESDETRRSRSEATDSLASTSFGGGGVGGTSGGAGSGRSGSSSGEGSFATAREGAEEELDGEEELGREVLLDEVDVGRH